MKIVVTGDWHIDAAKIGKTNPETDLDYRTEDYLAAVDRMIDFAIAKEADLFIMNGDLFKGRTSTHLIETLIAERFQRIASHMRLIINLGNHDYTARSLAFKSHTYSIIEKFNIQNVEVNLNTCHIVGDDVDIVLYPYHDARSREDYISNDVFLSSLEEQINSFKYSKPSRLFVGHGTPEGTIINEDYFFDLGTVDEPIIPKKVLKDFNLALFSHIHRTHWVGKKVFHIGSPERIDFSEADHEKGFSFYDSSTGTMEFISTDPRPMYDLVLDLNKNDSFTDPTEYIVKTLSELPRYSEALIKIHVICTEKTRMCIEDNKVSAQLGESFHHILKYTVIRTEERQVRMAEVTEHISDVDALEKVINSKETLSEEDKKQLLLRGKKVIALNEA